MAQQSLILKAQSLEPNTPQEVSADKSAYNLLHPTPPDLMREMDTDRPDQTESPYTVDAGHFQVELDFVSAEFDRDRSGGGDVETTSWGPSVNLKLGLLNNVDIQFVLEPYVRSESIDYAAKAQSTASGVGDLQTRLKLNLWGNDEGTTAFAMMPFVKWPLAKSGLRNGKTEPGLILILGCELPHGWSATGMTEADFVSDGASGYDIEFVNSITFSHQILGKLGGYVELFTVTSTAPSSRWKAQVDLGFVYALEKNIRFDFGCNFGVNKSAPDFNPFVGMSFRL